MGRLFFLGILQVFFSLFHFDYGCCFNLWSSETERSQSEVRFTVPRSSGVPSKVPGPWQHPVTRFDVRGVAKTLPNGRQNFVPADVDNPEDFDAGMSVDVVQAQRGQRCFSQQTSRFAGPYAGTCQTVSDCPPLQGVVDQIYNSGAISYLYSLLCRFTGEEIYFCCPPYTFGNSETPFRGQGPFVDLPEFSPVFAPIPGPEECGVQASIKDGRIVGGENVTEGRYPWLTVLGIPLDFEHFDAICTGSLITRRHVVTAAHCFRSSPLRNPTHARLNEADLLSNTSPPSQEYVIISFHAPLYVYGNTINDIMILTLHADVTFNDYVQPGCLPFDNPTEPEPGDTVIAAGYGLTRLSLFGVEFASFPQEVAQPVITNLECQNAFYEYDEEESIFGLYILDDRMFCAGGVNGTGPCFGDSGGPVMSFDNTTGKYLIVGVVNGGDSKCATDEHPAFFLRVGAFLPWIRKVTGN